LIEGVKANENERKEKERKRIDKSILCPFILYFIVFRKIIGRESRVWGMKQKNIQRNTLEGVDEGVGEFYKFMLLASTKVT
jgi:hypothetical protein